MALNSVKYMLFLAFGASLHAALPAVEVVPIPVADGGEGTVDAMLTAVGGEKIETACCGPYMERIIGFYGMLPDGTAVIEMAAAAGLPLVGEKMRPDRTTTYGVGELIADAPKREMCISFRQNVLFLTDVHTSKRFTFTFQ